MALLLPDLEAKNEDLFLDFLNQSGIFARLQGTYLQCVSDSS